jgi:hypothetical protein
MSIKYEGKVKSVTRIIGGLLVAALVFTFPIWGGIVAGLIVSLYDALLRLAFFLYPNAEVPIRKFLFILFLAVCGIAVFIGIPFYGIARSSAPVSPNRVLSQFIQLFKKEKKQQRK